MNDVVKQQIQQSTIANLITEAWGYHPSKWNRPISPIVYSHARTHACTHTHLCSHTHTQAHAHTHTLWHILTHTDKQGFGHLCMFVWFPVKNNLGYSQQCQLFVQVTIFLEKRWLIVSNALNLLHVQKTHHPQKQCWLYFPVYSIVSHWPKQN